MPKNRVAQEPSAHRGGSPMCGEAATGPAMLGQGIEMACFLLAQLLLVQFVLVSSERNCVLEAARKSEEMIVTESQASPAKHQPKRKRGLRGARAGPASSRALAFFLANQKAMSKAPETVSPGAARGLLAQRGPEKLLAGPHPQPRPTGLWIPYYHLPLLRRKCQRGVVPSGDEQPLRERINLRSRRRAPERLAGALSTARSPAHLPRAELQRCRCCWVEGRLL